MFPLLPLGSALTTPYTYDPVSGTREQQTNRVQVRNKLELIQSTIQRHIDSHRAVTAQYSSPPNYQYTAFAGRQYIVSGDVTFDVSKATSGPVYTLRKAQLVGLSAMAPVQPTQQDRAVALQAQRLLSQSRLDITQLTRKGSHIDTLV